MMGVLNLAHSAFYMLGAYAAYQISTYLGFWVGLLVAPPIVAILGAGVERYGLRKVHQYGHVPELIFTFGLFFVIEELLHNFLSVARISFSQRQINRRPRPLVKVFVTACDPTK